MKLCLALVILMFSQREQLSYILQELMVKVVLLKPGPRLPETPQKTRDGDTNPTEAKRRRPDWASLPEAVIVKITIRKQGVQALNFEESLISLSLLEPKALPQYLLVASWPSLPNVKTFNIQVI